MPAQKLPSADCSSSSSSSELFQPFLKQYKQCVVREEFFQCLFVGENYG
jgi:hypothetical protein